MARAFEVKVIEQCQISPPRDAPPISLPLTFFDIPWLLFSPSKTLFFYELPYSTSHFTTTTLPILKHSLSLTLHHFQPFSGNLSAPQPPSEPQIIYTDGDFVSLTIAEANADTFNHLSSNHPRDVQGLLSLVPQLRSTVTPNTPLLPLLSVQITIFRDTGMSIGLSFCHVVADERTFNVFMKSWASFCKSLLEGKSTFAILASPPSYNRNVIIDHNGQLQSTLLNQFWNRIIPRKSQKVDLDNMVLATFVFSPTDLENIRKWIVSLCTKKNYPQPLLLSPYVSACAFAWVCLIKSQVTLRAVIGEKPIFLGFVAGGIHRLDFRVPTTYFGNCVAFGRAGAMGHELLDEDGVIVAAKAVGKTIKDLDKEVLRDVEGWICEWEELVGSNGNIMVVGSPKVDLYEMDFGWGMPKKIEKISVERVNVICLTESRDFKGGIEVGVGLSRANLDSFTSLFNDGLELL